jgi:hypothetical protein
VAKYWQFAWQRASRISSVPDRAPALLLPPTAGPMTGRIWQCSVCCHMHRGCEYPQIIIQGRRYFISQTIHGYWLLIRTCMTAACCLICLLHGSAGLPCVLEAQPDRVAAQCAGGYQCLTAQAPAHGQPVAPRLSTGAASVHCNAAKQAHVQADSKRYLVMCDGRCCACCHQPSLGVGHTMY